jgi:hypothetical protein
MARATCKLFLGILLATAACTDKKLEPAASPDADPGVRVDGGSSVDGGAHLANPLFDDLPDSTALDLGLYSCSERMPQIANRCGTITDYSRFNYDPYRHRIVMFGGGHAATGRTDLDVFDLSTLTWTSAYDSMSCEEVALGDLDPRGFHLATGHPVSRHTYDMTVVADDDGAGSLLLLSKEGFPGTCHDYASHIRAVASYPLSVDETTAAWSHGAEFSMPWYYAASAEFDPVSGMVVVLGNTSGSGEGGMWIYDPRTDQVVTFVDEVRYGGIDGNLVYYPPDQKMYYFQRGDPNKVWRVDLDRSDWSLSRSLLLTPSGVAPTVGSTGFAYDSRNQIIGGAFADGIFHVYDPMADAWTSEPINVISEEGTLIDSMGNNHMLDYDPVDNVFVVITASPARTWAYRYRN